MIKLRNHRCFVAYGLLLTLDQTPLCELIGLPNLGDGNSELFIAAVCDVPGFDILGEVVQILPIYVYV